MSVWQGNKCLRQPVGLEASPSSSFQEVMHLALAFEDSKKMNEASIMRTLAAPVDVVVRWVRRGEPETSFCVRASTKLSSATVFGPFNRVEYIIPANYEVRIFSLPRPSFLPRPRPVADSAVLQPPPPPERSHSRTGMHSHR